MKRTIILTLRWMILLSSAHAADKAKVVFLSRKPGHGRMKHEHRPGDLIAADALNTSGWNVDAIVLL